MSEVDDARPGGLLAWQLARYPDNHTDRTSLVIHAVTVPLFWFGTLALLGPAAGHWTPAVGGLVACIVAVALQGRGHRRERVPPIPFRGPLDVVVRIVVEQWITFPRFVLGGGFSQAWRRSR